MVLIRTNKYNLKTNDVTSKEQMDKSNEPNKNQSESDVNMTSIASSSSQKIKFEDRCIDDHIIFDNIEKDVPIPSIKKDESLEMLTTLDEVIPDENIDAESPNSRDMMDEENISDVELNELIYEDFDDLIVLDDEEKKGDTITNVNEGSNSMDMEINDDILCNDMVIIDSIGESELDDDVTIIEHAVKSNCSTEKCEKKDIVYLSSKPAVPGISFITFTDDIAHCNLCSLSKLQRTAITDHCTSKTHCLNILKRNDIRLYNRIKNKSIEQDCLITVARRSEYNPAIPAKKTVENDECKRSENNSAIPAMKTLEMDECQKISSLLHSIPNLGVSSLKFNRVVVVGNLKYHPYINRFQVNNGTVMKMNNCITIENVKQKFADMKPTNFPNSLWLLFFGIECIGTLKYWEVCEVGLCKSPLYRLHLKDSLLKGKISRLSEATLTSLKLLEDHLRTLVDKDSDVILMPFAPLSMDGRKGNRHDDLHKREIPPFYMDIRQMLIIDNMLQHFAENTSLIFQWRERKNLNALALYYSKDICGLDGNTGKKLHAYITYVCNFIKYSLKPEQKRTLNPEILPKSILDNTKSVRGNMGLGRFKHAVFVGNEQLSLLCDFQKYQNVSFINSLVEKGWTTLHPILSQIKHDKKNILVVIAYDICSIITRMKVKENDFYYYTIPRGSMPDAQALLIKDVKSLYIDCVKYLNSEGNVLVAPLISRCVCNWPSTIQERLTIMKNDDFNREHCPVYVQSVHKLDIRQINVFQRRFFTLFCHLNGSHGSWSKKVSHIFSSMESEQENFITVWRQYLQENILWYGDNKNVAHPKIFSLKILESLKSKKRKFAEVNLEAKVADNKRKAVNDVTPVLKSALSPFTCPNFFHKIGLSQLDIKSKLSNKVYNHVYIIGSQEVIEQISMIKFNMPVTFIEHVFSESLEIDLATLNQKLSPLQDKFMCLMLYDINFFVSKSHTDGFCNRNKCRDSLTLMYVRDKTENACQKFICDKIKVANNFLSKYASTFPCFLVPLPPHSIFCDFVDIDSHCKLHSISKKSYMGMGNKRFWDTYWNLVLEEWAKLLEKQYEKCEIITSINEYIETVKPIFYNNLNNASSIPDQKSAWIMYKDMLTQLLTWIMISAKNSNISEGTVTLKDSFTLKNSDTLKTSFALIESGTSKRSFAHVDSGTSKNSFALKDSRTSKSSFALKDSCTSKSSFVVKGSHTSKKPVVLKDSRTSKRSSFAAIDSGTSKNSFPLKDADTFKSSFPLKDSSNVKSSFRDRGTFRSSFPPKNSGNIKSLFSIKCSDKFKYSNNLNQSSIKSSHAFKDSDALNSSCYSNTSSDIKSSHASKDYSALKNFDTTAIYDQICEFRVSKLSTAGTHNFIKEVIYKMKTDCKPSTNSDGSISSMLPLKIAKVLEKKLNNMRISYSKLRAECINFKDYQIDSTDKDLEKVTLTFNQAFDSWKECISQEIFKDSFSLVDLATFKTKLCDGRCSDPHLCILNHGTWDRRRNPFIHCYKNTMCPIGEKGSCPYGMSCELSHNLYEQQYHPSTFQHNPCTKKTYGKSTCSKLLCKYYHKDTPEIIFTPDWEDQICFGLDKTVKFLTTSIQSLDKLQYQDDYFPKILVISPSMEFLEMLQIGLESLSNSNPKTCSMLNMNFVYNENRCDVLLGSPKLFGITASGIGKKLSQVALIIIDDFKHIMDDVVLLQNLFVFIKHIKNFLNFSELSIVVTLDDFDPKVPYFVSRFFNKPFKIVPEAGMDPSIGFCPKVGMKRRVHTMGQTYNTDPQKEEVNSKLPLDHSDKREIRRTQKLQERQTPEKIRWPVTEVEQNKHEFDQPRNINMNPGENNSYWSTGESTSEFPGSAMSENSFTRWSEPVQSSTVLTHDHEMSPFVEEPWKLVREPEAARPSMNDDQSRIHSALIMLLEFSENTKYMGPDIHNVMTNALELGTRTSDVLQYLSQSSNLSLIKNIISEIAATRVSGHLKPLYEKVIEHSMDLLNIVGRQPCAKLDMPDVDEIARATLGKDSVYILEVIKTSLYHHGHERPSKELINKLFLEICSSHFNMTVNNE